MHYREVQIEDDLSVADSGTLTVDLNIKDPITALIIRFKATNDGNPVYGEAPERQISKVEIVDGGQVYYSLNGPMAVAAACYGLGRWPHVWYNERASQNQRCNFPILFGRYIGDPDFGFDPTRLVNPQLKVTWTDQAGYLNGSLAIGITARVMEGVPTPAKVLLWKEIEAWASAGSGVHTVDLPTDYPYRSLMIRPHLDDNIPSNILTEFKLDCDVGKLIVFDLASHEFRDVIKQADGPFQHRQFIYGTSANRHQANMGETISCFGSPDQAGFVYTWTSWSSYFFASVSDHAGSGIDTATIQASIEGEFPHSAYLYRFGRRNDPETWFRSTQYGDIDLKLSEGVASAAMSVAVQQPRTIP